MKKIILTVFCILSFAMGSLYSREMTLQDIENQISKVGEFEKEYTRLLDNYKVISNLTESTEPILTDKLRIWSKNSFNVLQQTMIENMYVIFNVEETEGFKIHEGPIGKLLTKFCDTLWQSGSTSDDFFTAAKIVKTALEEKLSQYASSSTKESQTEQIQPGLPLIQESKLTPEQLEEHIKKIDNFIERYKTIYNAAKPLYGTSPLVKNPEIPNSIIFNNKSTKKDYEVLFLDISTEKGSYLETDPISQLFQDMLDAFYENNKTSNNFFDSAKEAKRALEKKLPQIETSLTKELQFTPKQFKNPVRTITLKEQSTQPEISVKKRPDFTKEELETLIKNIDEYIKKYTEICNKILTSYNKKHPLENRTLKDTEVPSSMIKENETTLREYETLLLTIIAKQKIVIQAEKEMGFKQFQGPVTQLLQNIIYHKNSDGKEITSNSKTFFDAAEKAKKILTEKLKNLQQKNQALQVPEQRISSPHTSQTIAVEKKPEPVTQTTVVEKKPEPSSYNLLLNRLASTTKSSRDVLRKAANYLYNSANYYYRKLRGAQQQ